MFVMSAPVCTKVECEYCGRSETFVPGVTLAEAYESVLRGPWSIYALPTRPREKIQHGVVCDLACCWQKWAKDIAILANVCCPDAEAHNE